MNLHEYQGKQLLRKYNVPTPEGLVIDKAEFAVESAMKLQQMTDTEKWAIKAQIHAGGRGKGGGVKIAKNLEEVENYASSIIGMQLVTPQTGSQGKKVGKVLIEQNIFYEGESEIQEFYMSIMLDRAKKQNVIIYSPRGGMDIEAVAAETPEFIFREYIDPVVGIQGFQCRRIAFNLGLSGDAWKSMVRFAEALYNTYIGSDATLLEINPVMKTSDNKSSLPIAKFQLMKTHCSDTLIFLPCEISVKKTQQK
jgi:succinyl-CoA synthetase beta subunit